MARVVVDDKALQKRLADMAKRSGDCSAFTRSASIRMHRDVMEHFDRETAPTSKWKAWSPEYKKARERGRGGNKILQDTGILRNSIRFTNDRNTANVGTNIVYAPTHNYGDSKRNIPKREFMWLSPALIKDLAARFTRFIALGENSGV